jgi:hypothetical protein
MDCPLIHDACRAKACAMWIDDYCILDILVRRFCEASCFQEAIGNDPEQILNGCAKWVRSSSIEALHRRDIDNYLAYSQIALDFTQRRALLRMWRNARRISRKEYGTHPNHWRTRETNRGALWSNEEDAELTAWFRSGVSIESIAAHHKRSLPAIECRLRKLGLMPSESDGGKEE